MQSESVARLAWPDFGNTVSIVALALALAVFVFAALSGARANKFRIVFAVGLATAIGWFILPLAVKAAEILHVADTNAGTVGIVTVMLFLVAAVATGIYEIITVTFPDIGMSAKK